MKIFCQYIAPALGITERFVGEEPTDKVTRQYNEEMKQLLPYYNMKLTEIPRVKFGEEWISASRVRAYCKEGRWAYIKAIVPEAVYDYLWGKTKEVV